jgi:hypothetical protein
MWSWAEYWHFKQEYLRVIFIFPRFVFLLQVKIWNQTVGNEIIIEKKLSKILHKVCLTNKINDDKQCVLCISRYI